MPVLVFKNIPGDDCMAAMAERYPDIDSSAMFPYLHFLRTSAELVQYVDKMLGAHGMAMGRMSVMMTLHIDPAGTSTPGQIAERCGVTAATITRLVDGLLADGLVERTADAVDRRSLRVTITDKGRAQMEQLLPPHFRNIAELFSVFTKAERKEMARLLEKLFGQLDKLNSELK